MISRAKVQCRKLYQLNSKDQRLKCNERTINVLQEITVTAAPLPVPAKGVLCG